MALKQQAAWRGLRRVDWIKKIDESLGPNCHLIQNQGPDHSDREPDEHKRDSMINDARLRMLGELTEIIWQMKENYADEVLIEQTEDLQYYILACDITDREVRMQVQNHVDSMHKTS
jgi:hypothetical protein